SRRLALRDTSPKISRRRHSAPRGRYPYATRPEEGAMTPQERELISELFDRLATLESAPRDPEAERVIADEQKRAPHAIYPLVQTVLVQDEALKAANAHIQDLEARLGDRGDNQPSGGGGFLDTMRNNLFGHREAPRSS